MVGGVSARVGRFLLRAGRFNPSLGTNSMRRDEAAGRSASLRSTDRWSIGIRDLGARRSVVQLPSLVHRGFAHTWRASRWATAGLCLVSVSSAAAMVGQLLAARELLRGVDLRGSGASALRLLPWVIVVALLSVLSLVVTSASLQLRRYLGQLVMRDSSRSMLGVTATVPLITFESEGFFDHVQRVDANSLNKPLDIVNSVTNILASSLTMVGLAIVVATTAPLLLPALVLTALPVYLSNRRTARMEFDFAAEQAGRIRERSYIGSLLRSRDAAKEVRAYSLTDVLLTMWDRRYAEFIVGLRRLTRMRVLYTAVAALASATVLAVAMYALIASIHSRDSLIAAATALVALRLLASQLQSAAGAATGLYQSRLFLDDLDSFLAHRKPAMQDVSAHSQQVGPPDSLEFDRVSFSYPGSTKPALRDVSFTLRKGEVLALVGENGSGKTTLAKLIAQLFEPTSGHIRWNGREAETLDAEQMRARIAIVFQDFLRYDFTVAQNIAFGRSGEPIDPAEIREAARRAAADSFIDQLPDRYETVLSRVYASGSDLSIGQWQRLALARAFYRDADLVVLDEPTAALDPRGEQALFESTRQLFTHRSVVLISHRFSSVRSADRILVMDGGEVVESGTHDELMAAKGLYQELFTIQAGAYVDV